MKLLRLECIDSKLLRLENVESLLKQVVFDQGRIAIGLTNAETKLDSRGPQQSGVADNGEEKKADGQITQIANTDGRITLTDIKLKPDGEPALVEAARQTKQLLEAEGMFKHPSAHDP